MSDIVVRPARPDEFAALGALTLAAYEADGLLLHAAGESYAAELRDAAQRAEQAELLAAVDASGTLLGTVTVAPPGTPYAEISRDGEVEFRMLAVAPEARGRGVGEALTRAVLDRARDLGATRVVLCSLDLMKSAHRLYARLGFTRLPDRDWEPVPGVTLYAYGLTL
ncbi:GNAT family N-acetyltransferase [Prauserella oleivorans]|uniref:GNAT family N-acetyltransferase n=1 Tax=Prauserella oleivorans TaxID=1478153 RepID=A0ABW5W8X9_9PSEU